MHFSILTILSLAALSQAAAIKDRQIEILTKCSDATGFPLCCSTSADGSTQDCSTVSNLITTERCDAPKTLFCCDFSVSAPTGVNVTTPPTGATLEGLSCVLGPTGFLNLG